MLITEFCSLNQKLANPRQTDLRLQPVSVFVDIVSPFEDVKIL